MGEAGVGRAGAAATLRRVRGDSAYGASDRVLLVAVSGRARAGRPDYGAGGGAAGTATG